MTLTLLAGHVVALAEVADCEWRPDGRVRQDVNAASSLAYVAAAAVAAVRAWRRRPRTVPAMWLLLAAVALEGAGSVAYHAGSGDGARLAHDLPLLAIVGFVAGWQWARVVVGRPGGAGPTSAGARTGWPAGAGAAATVAGAVLWSAGVTATAALTAVGVAAAAAAEVVGRLRSLPSLWAPPLLGVVVLGVVAWAAGQPGSPACEPGSWLQPHALWHVATAVAVAWWADRAGHPPG